MSSSGERYDRSLKSVGKGTTALMVSTALLFLFNLIGRVTVAREFTVGAWGEFNLGVSLSGLLTLVAMLGLANAIARAISYEKDPAEQWAIIRWGLTISLVSSVLGTVAMYILAPDFAIWFHNSGLTIVFQLFALSVGFTVMANILAAIFQGFEDASPNAWFNQVVAPGGFVVALFIALFLHVGFDGVLWAYAIGQGLALVLISVYTWRRLPKLVPHVGLPKKRPKPGLWTLSFALWGVSSLAVITGYFDTLVLGVFRPSTAVGLYSAATTLARVLLAANLALTYIYLPVAARLVRDGDFETLRRTYATSTRWIILFMVPLLLLFCFDPALSLTAIFDQSYTGASISLVILSIGSFVSVAVGPVNATLAGMAASRILLISMAASAIANVGLSLALIPSTGILGASIAWSVARIIYPGIGTATLWISHRVTPFQAHFTRPLVWTLILGSPVYLLASFLHLATWWVVPLYFFGVALFLAALLATRSVDRGDMIAAAALEQILHRPMPRLRAFLERYIRATPEPPLPH
jgi:O-antigen/teichoic acid export membrane protein